MFASNYPPHTGGLETVVSHLAIQLAASHEVTVVTTAWSAARSVARERGVAYPVPVGLGLGAALASVESADIFHAHGAVYTTTLLAKHAARRAGKPLVLTEHSGFVHYRQRALDA